MYIKEREEDLKINSSVVGMESQRSYKAARATNTRFSVTDYRGGLNQGSNALNTQIGNDSGNAEGKTGESSSQRAATTLEDWQSRFQSGSARLNLRSTPMQSFETIRHRTISYILDLFFGNRKSVWQSWSQRSSMQSSSFQWQTVQERSANINVINFFQESYQYESEQTFFSTTGTVRTADGREINFNVNVGMSREFEQYYREELGMSALQVTDPLVINLDGDVADVSDQTFYFDIDGDGVLDEINQLGSGSGFLALDKNGDGVINDGSELFGTASGNGFKDLAQYDEDGNGWIDENDSIWDKLLIWCKDENGNDMLYKLADKGVGAICLQNVGTEFTQQAQDGSAKSVIRNTGVFLYEDGNVGTIQHVDMAKHSYSA